MGQNQAVTRGDLLGGLVQDGGKEGGLLWDCRDSREGGHLYGHM
jgi:hypothetical protein